MPIDKAQFEKGFDEKEPDHILREILQFLGQHPDQAFTFTEIVQGIGQFRPQDHGIDFLTIVGVGRLHSVGNTSLGQACKEGYVCGCISARPTIAPFAAPADEHTASTFVNAPLVIIRRRPSSVSPFALV